MKPESKPESPKIAPKKVPPPISPKPEHLKMDATSSNKKLDMKKPPVSTINMDELLGELQDFIEKFKEPEPYGIPGPSNTSASEPEPIPEPKPEIIKEIDSASIPLPESPKIGPQLNPEEVRLAKQETRKLDKKAKELEQANLDNAMRLAKSSLLTQLSEKEMIDSMYEKAEKYYAKYIGPDEFDWICLNEEIKNRADGTFVKSPTDTWEALLDDMVMRFREWYNAINGNKESHIYPTNEEIAHILEKYHKKRELEFVSPPKGFKTIKIENIVEKPSIINERKCALANDERESWSDDAEDEWYNELADA